MLISRFIIEDINATGAVSLLEYILNYKILQTRKGAEYCFSKKREYEMILNTQKQNVKKK